MISSSALRCPGGSSQLATSLPFLKSAVGSPLGAVRGAAAGLLKVLGAAAGLFGGISDALSHATTSYLGRARAS